MRRSARAVVDALMISGYALHTMRTTISLEDRLAMQVRSAAARRGLSVSRFIADTLDDALKRREPDPPRPFRLVTVGGEGPRPGVDLDRPRTLDIAADEAEYRGLDR